MFNIFKRTSRPAVDHVEPEPDEELKAEMRVAQFIQQKAHVGALFATRLSDPNENYAEQLRHYQSVRDDLLSKLDTISDEFCRNFAAHQLIKMCMTADDRAVAKALLVGIRDTSIREYVHNDAPSLRTTG